MLYLRAGFSNKCNCNYSIFITFNYNPNYVTLMKTFKQRAWDNERKEWEIGQDSYNDLMNTINAYGIPYNKEEYEYSVQVLKEQVASMQAIQKQEANVDASILDSVEFKLEPYPYQKEGIAYGLIHDKFLNADEMGTGKTAQASHIARLKRGGNHCLVIVGYKSLLFNWVREIKTHTDESAYVLGQRMGKRTKKLHTGTLEDRLEDLQNLDKIEEFFIITDITTLRQCKKEEYTKKNGKKGINKQFFFADLIEDWCRKGEIGRIILDEAHVFSTYEVDQTQALLRLKTCPYKIALTGTPIMNKNLDLYPIMVWLGYENRNYWEFRERYCRLGGFQGKQVIGDKNSPELHQRLAQFMLRRLKKDVLDLPEKVIIDEYLEMDGKQWALYTKVDKMMKAELAQMKGNKNKLLAALTNLRKITCHPAWYDPEIECTSVKYERTKQIIEEAVKNNQKTIVFSCWTTPFLADIECLNLKRELEKYNPAMIIGDTKDRMGEVDKFQNDSNCMVMLGSVKAMGVGITLTAASNVIWLDEPWNPALKEQGNDRTHRPGQRNNVNIYTLMCEGTKDIGVHNTIYNKSRVFSEIVDGVSPEELENIIDNY